MTTEERLERLEQESDCKTNLIMYQQVNMQGQAAMKAALLINGGASVAMLAFISTAMNNSTPIPLLSKLGYSMLMFTGGVLLAAVALGVTYSTGLANIRYIKKSGKQLLCFMILLNGIAIGLVVIGYGLFITGSWNAYKAFMNHFVACS